MQGVAGAAVRIGEQGLPGGLGAARVAGDGDDVEPGGQQLPGGGLPEAAAAPVRTAVGAVMAMRLSDESAG